MDDFEKTIRERTGQLLAETGKSVAKKNTIVAKTKKPRPRNKKGVKPDFLERAKKIKRRVGIPPNGYSLVERLLARTDPQKWYSHAQLLRLLPETGKDGLHAILYQKCRRLGLVERLALIELAETPWLAAEKIADRGVAAQQPRYVYRIGAYAATERALAREKEAEWVRVRREG